MKHLFHIILFSIIGHFIFAQTQPALHVDENQTVLFGKDTITSGIKLLWYPSKAAFRAGKADNTEWTQENAGLFSSAFGSGTEARGSYSAAFGLSTWAFSYGETSIGRYSLGGGNIFNWVETDALFEVGNGSSSMNRSNAFTVYKNGNVEVESSIKVGDHAGTSPADGTIRWSGTDFEGYDNEWKSLTSNSNTGDYGTVVNPITGKVWLDRNLGADQVATSSSDAAGFGDLHQWGRSADGHQERTSTTINTIATSWNSGLIFNDWTGKFIIGSDLWLNTGETHMWSGRSAENNPCPSGFRVPTNAEWEQERLTWTSNNSDGAFASPLKLPMAGDRPSFSGTVSSNIGRYWSSTISGNGIVFLELLNNNARIQIATNGRGCSVRCIKD